MTTGLLESVNGITKTSPERRAHWIVSLQYVDTFDVPGDIVECGVWRGGNVVLARKVCPSRRVWLYDTFEGMTKPGVHDVRRSGGRPDPQKVASKTWTAASVEEVQDNLRAHGVLDRDLTQFVVGDVLDTLRVESNLPDKIALLRLDTDWYESTKIELETLFPRLSSGGILIVDDYGHWMGARKATQDYLKRHAPYYVRELKPVDYTASAMIKR